MSIDKPTFTFILTSQPMFQEAHKWQYLEIFERIRAGYAVGNLINGHPLTRAGTHSFRAPFFRLYHYVESSGLIGEHTFDEFIWIDFYGSRTISGMELCAFQHLI